MNRREYIHCDNKYFDELDLKTKIRLYITGDHWIAIRKYLSYLRSQEYYMTRYGMLGKLASLYFARKKNKLGLKLGFHISANVLGTGVSIYHHGAIIVNGDAKIGKNCVLHGMNCIGNNGKSKGVPIIGDNVDIGAGASIIGGVRIADDVKIGAGAVVIKDCLEPGATLVGVPAKQV